jgi:gluconate 2-dehydrogenase gamma chain
LSKSVGRRKFLKQAAAGTAAALTPNVTAAASTLAPPQEAQRDNPAPSSPASAGYTFLNANEAAFIEAFVDVIVPADELTPSGTDLGLATFIDRQLAGAWGNGDRLYMQGPWQQGSPGQGYQLPLKPSEFFRASIAAVNQHCKVTNGKEFDRLPTDIKEQVVTDLAAGKITLGDILSSQFFEVAYQAVMEGMFGDPIYGGNRDKAAWKMIGYPGVIAIHAENIEKYRNKPYPVKPVSIADLM